MSTTTPSRITLLTDFGTADGYVGAMKGVIASILPGAIIDDITHDIAHGDVAAAAWCVAAHHRYWPAGTVHVCVVDPGVGSARRAIAVEVDGQRFIAPDNGILTVPLHEPGAHVVEITDRQYMRADVSTTFHGRDIFAVAGAHVAGGVPIGALGVVVTDPVLLPLPSFETRPNGVRGEVVHVDRFGNLITNIPAHVVNDGDVRVVVEPDTIVPFGSTYADAAPGELIALIGSGGVLEVALRDGSAAERLGVRRGAPVTARTRNQNYETSAPDIQSPRF